MTGGKASSMAANRPGPRDKWGESMKKVACLAVLAAILPGAALAADCVYPKQPPKPPNGNRAARSEMLAAIKVNNKYQADITAFLTCLKAEHEANIAKIDPSLDAKAAEKEKTKLDERWASQNDAAVDEAQEAADRINEQIRVCKARPDGCTK
jgi:opacity protein-like surface antigen